VLPCRLGWLIIMRIKASRAFLTYGLGWLLHSSTAESPRSPARKLGAARIMTR
jgi:hypothetical protein